MVQPGDTVIGISEKLAVRWDVVAAQNKLANPDLIYPEQVLVIREDARLR
jgi:nucleoid-associated protein YgaU